MKSFEKLSYLDFIRRYIRESYEFIKNRVSPRQKWIKKYIPYYDYCDKDLLLLKFNFGVVIEFVEEEKCFETVDWEYNEKYSEFAAFIRACYRYIKHQRPRLLNVKKKCTNRNQLFRIITYIKNKDVYYLTNIAKYHHFFWT